MTAVTTGLVVGSIYALVALGYNLTFLAAGVLNFAHANLIILGAFLAVTLGASGFGLPFVAVLLLSALVVAVVGLVEERVAIRPIAGRGTHAELVTTVGAATVITGSILLIWGDQPLRVPSPLPEAAFTVAGARMQPIDVALVAIAVAVTVALHLFTHRSRFGIACLAQSEDRDAAQLCGINVRQLSLVSFAIAAALAGVLGPVIGVKTFAVTTIPLILAIKGFVALTLGGVGSNVGALVGGLTIGMAEAVITRYFGADYQLVLVFVLFIAVAMFKPEGIFGTKVARLV